MRKEKFKANFKRNPSIPGRETSRPESVSAKHNKQIAHRAPVRRAASKGRGF
jgi:predicted 2-oxoglutarate/Fe(II)-dependent dioxygenase YbiX